MEIALIENFPGHGFEVWITDVIEIGAGMGDVFTTRHEALEYATEHGVPIADLTHIEMTYLEGEELRDFLKQFLEISPAGEVLSIRQ